MSRSKTTLNKVFNDNNNYNGRRLPYRFTENFYRYYGYYGSLINQKFTMSLDEIEIFFFGGGGILV